MKRYVVIVAVVAAVVGVGWYTALGQAQRSGVRRGGMMPGGMMNQAGQQQNMMQNDQGMMPMAGMHAMMGQGMAHAMAQTSLVATSDGGVVLWAGGKLIKYDSDLRLVREVEVQVDYKAMQQHMQQMMDNLGMGPRMMQRSGGMMRGSNQDSDRSSPSP
ncbi:MAG TPA: hypothetical protein ENO24_06970 [Chloroflexi bacterium]|nr:hypothetical protein [Chloroflexota bacterium]